MRNRIQGLQSPGVPVMISIFAKNPRPLASTKLTRRKFQRAMVSSLYKTKEEVEERLRDAMIHVRSGTISKWTIKG